VANYGSTRFLNVFSPMKPSASAEKVR